VLHLDNIIKLHEISDKLHELQVSYSKLNWTLYTTGYDFGIQEAYTRMVGELKNKESYEYILKCRALNISPTETRQVEIMYNAFKSYHLSEDLNKLDMEIRMKTNELSKILNTFRYTFEGKTVSSVELNQVLSSDTDRERRKAAYFAKNQINKPMVDGGFIDLIKLRKDYAHAYGSENFIAHRLDAVELDKSTFDNWLPQLHDLLPKMNNVRSKYAKKFLNADKIMPWDEQFIDSRIAPSLNTNIDMSSYYNNIRELFQFFGIDISSFNITYDVFPRTNKSEWGYNFPIDTAKDSRILANVKNKYLEYGVLLHETGHATHSFLLNPEEKILNRGVSGIINEGIANLFGSFLTKPLFYKKFFKDSDNVEKEFSALKEYRSLNSLRAINRIFFDHSFYKNDVETLDDIYGLYWKTYSEVLKEEPFGTEPPWAFTIHHTTHPIYLHNYLMGDVTCEMLSKVFKNKYNASMEEKPVEFGEFLINEVIRPSGMYKYNELFKKISGEDFSLKYMTE
jgi:oligoendopeptidase F